jgi:hypothetical protein
MIASRQGIVCAARGRAGSNTSTNVARFRLGGGPPPGRIHPTPAPLRWIRHTSLAVLRLEPARPRAAFLELARGPLLPDPALGSLIASLNRFLSGGNAVALEELID